MMIPINIEVKESAYDKVIYLLNHLKDDVRLINATKVGENQKSLDDLVEFRKLSQELSSVGSDVDILSIEQDINSDIF